jgi:hypothetical protein
MAVLVVVEMAVQQYKLVQPAEPKPQAESSSSLPL